MLLCDSIVGECKSSLNDACLKPGNCEKLQMALIGLKEPATVTN